jgi:hypothetical protein
MGLRPRAARLGRAIPLALFLWPNEASAPENARLNKPPLFSRDTEVAGQEIRGCLVGSYPGSVPQKAVDLIGKHELFEWNIPLLEPARKIDSLLEPHVAIVITLYQEDGRLPAVDRGVGR